MACPDLPDDDATDNRRIIHRFVLEWPEMPRTDRAEALARFPELRALVSFDDPYDWAIVADDEETSAQCRAMDGDFDELDPDPAEVAKLRASLAAHVAAGHFPQAAVVSRRLDLMGVRTIQTELDDGTEGTPEPDADV